MKQRSLLAALALAAALPGCPGSLEDPGRFNGQFGTGGGDGGGACPDVPALFASTCTSAGCHGTMSPANGLDLASGNLFTRLSGMKAMGGAGLLVDPQNPAASVLYVKLTATPPFGGRMPLVGAPLDDTTVGCVLTWITKGGSP